MFIQHTIFVRLGKACFPFGDFFAPTSKKQCDWVVHDVISVCCGVDSQSSCFFLCSREQIRLVENRLYNNRNCIVNFYTKGTGICDKHIDLGVKKDYKNFILGNQLSASSSDILSSQRFPPSSGRLDLKENWLTYGAWKPEKDDANPWLQVDFQRDTVVGMISTQGREDEFSKAGVRYTEDFVKTYTLSYSNDGKTFQEYKVSA